MNRITATLPALALVALLAACGSAEAAPAAAPASSSATASSAPSAIAVKTAMQKAAEGCGITGGSVSIDGRQLLTGDANAAACAATALGAPHALTARFALVGDGEESWTGYSARWDRIADQGQVAIAADGATLPEVEDFSKKAIADASAAAEAESAEPAATPAAEPEVPAEFEAALAKADSYANTMNMSKASLHERLTSSYGEGFPKAAADYAVKHVVADWKANALAKAKSYRDDMNMSNSAIRNQLTSKYGERFTKAEAAYAMANLGK